MIGRRGLGPLSDDERRDWLRLIRSENVGPQTFRALMARFKSAGAACEALPQLALRGGAMRPVKVASRDEAERELKDARRLGVRFVAIREPDYPPALARIAGAPPLIALCGRLEALQQPAVAIVGSRNASASGLAFTDRLARELGAAGYVIVSGLARGIDHRAHVASLSTGAVGVLAGGHAKPYPPESVDLIPRICEYGAVLSEMPLNWEPRGRDFPRRNRLVSGLSLGVVVVEAARGSGSLITARLALEQNREVFAVPGSPLDPRAEGTIDLLRSGANLCARAEDVLSVLEPIREQDSRGPTLPDEGSDLPLWGEDEGDAAAGPQPSSGIDEPPEDFDFVDVESRDRERIAGLLGPSPIAIDELARVAGLPVAQVRGALLELDLAGRIARAGGDRVSLASAPTGN